MSDVIASVLQQRVTELAGTIKAAEADIALTVSQVADAAVRIAGKKAELTEARAQLKVIETELERRKPFVVTDDSFRIADPNGGFVSLKDLAGRSEAVVTVGDLAARFNTITSVAADPPPARADD